MANDLLSRLGIQCPIILAPLAGGPSTPELAAAVSNAGGLGSLGLEYLSLDQIRAHIRRFRELSRGPLNANLFAPVTQNFECSDSGQMRSAVAQVERELRLPVQENTAPVTPSLQDKLSVVLDIRPEVFSFTFGLMPSNLIQRLKEANVFVIGTATTAEEARQLAASDVDAVVAQGSEAGGHRGTFAASFAASMVPTTDLVREIKQVTTLPTIASGGLMDGHDIRRALDAGAQAVQLGTAFLACPEAGTSKPYREALLNARENSTMITRAFSGRPARGLRNRWASQWEHEEDKILPFPQQNSLTRPMRKAASEKGIADYLSLWAGTGVPRIRRLPAADLMRKLIEEMNF